MILVKNEKKLSILFHKVLTKTSLVIRHFIGQGILTVLSVSSEKEFLIMEECRKFSNIKYTGALIKMRGIANVIRLDTAALESNFKYDFKGRILTYLGVL